MTTKNNKLYLFADYEEHRKAPIPRLIWKDHHTSWDRSHYDFGHYGGKVQQDTITTKQVII